MRGRVRRAVHVEPWQVLEPLELLALDLRFLEDAAPWPELLQALAERMAGHGRSLALRLAISQMPRLDSRLKVMLWHLADRFGRVDRAGVLIPIRLSHAVLAEPVSAQREPVTRRLKQPADDGSSSTSLAAGACAAPLRR